MLVCLLLLSLEVSHAVYPLVHLIKKLPLAPKYTYGHFYTSVKEVKHIVPLIKQKPVFRRRQISYGAMLSWPILGMHTCSIILWHAKMISKLSIGVLEQGEKENQPLRFLAFLTMGTARPETHSEHVSRWNLHDS